MYAAKLVREPGRSDMRMLLGSLSGDAAGDDDDDGICAGAPS
jgi:hypothetical protein